MCLGKATPRSLDLQAVAAELQAAEQELSTSAQVCMQPIPSQGDRHVQMWPVQLSLQAVTSRGAYVAQSTKSLLSTVFLLGLCQPRISV